MLLAPTLAVARPPKPPPPPPPRPDEPFLLLVDVELVDADGDRHWRAGEAATLKATLVNTLREDFPRYPTVQVTTSDPRVKVDDAGWALFGLGARSSFTLQSPVASELGPGDHVTFTLRSMARHCDAESPENCVPEDVVTLEAEVE